MLLYILRLKLVIKPDKIHDSEFHSFDDKLHQMCWILTYLRIESM